MGRVEQGKGVRERTEGTEGEEREREAARQQVHCRRAAHLTGSGACLPAHGVEAARQAYRKHKQRVWQAQPAQQHGAKCIKVWA